MKRILFLLIPALIALPQCFGQKLVIGDRMPELKIKSWIGTTPQLENKALMVEFYHSSNKASAKRLHLLNELGKSAVERLTVVVITRERSDSVLNLLTAGKPSYYVALDDGKIATAFNAQYVPYSVIANRRGRVVWLGNPITLTNEKILQMIP